MDITKDLSYQEGYWAGKSVIKNIEFTTYKDLETAIAIKENLIANFENDFGYTREDWNKDSNYSYNCGMLDKLLEEKE
jgi:hypothetical protein